MDFQDDRYDENFTEEWRQQGMENSEEINSRSDNKLLWELYDDIAPKAAKADIPVDWVSDDFETVIIGNYEVSQGVFGRYNFKCLDIIPHGSDDMSKYKLFFNEVEDGMSFFEAHIYALEEQKETVA